MWDHVQWSPEEFEEARQKAEENSRERVSIEEQVRHDRDANMYWNEFYEMHQNKFFKNRQWLFSEFPELLPQGCEADHTSGGQESGVTDLSSQGACHKDLLIDSPVVGEQRQHTTSNSTVEPHNSVVFPGQHASFRILEVGCGAGNSVFPIINTIRSKSRP